MFSLKNIRPVSDFVRNAKAHVKRLEGTDEPEILTINGEARLVMMNIDVFQKLADDAEETRLIKSLEEGIEEAKRGGGVPANVVFAALEKKFAARRKKRA